MIHPNSPAQAFKLKDAASYDSVARDFDHYTERTALPLARRMIEMAKLSPSDQALDVGTGTGIVALQAARELGQGGKVLGIDLSAAMMGLATAKAAQAGLTARVEFRQMDAEALTLAEGSFDVALSLFALLHFPHPLTALTEMFRVLRPGGRLALAVGSRPPLFSRPGLAHRFSRLPDLWHTLRGRQLTAPAALNGMVEKYFPATGEPEESALAGSGLNRTHKVSDLVGQAGFVEVRTDWAGHQLLVDSPEEFWQIQRTFSSIARKRLDQTPPEKVALLQAEFLHACHTVQARGGRLVYPVAAFFIVAQRPHTQATQATQAGNAGN